MDRAKMFLSLILLLAITSTFAETATTIGEVPKPSYARTVLKVSRSLPGETEELKVRTSEGDLATLIVKRREKSISNNVDVPSTPQSASSTNISSSSNSSSISSNSSSSSSTEAPTTIGYQNVEVDPWNRLQTWSSVSEAKKIELQTQKQQTTEDTRNWIPLSRGFDSWKPVSQPFSSETAKRSSLIHDQLNAGRGFQMLQADSNSNEKVLRYAILPHEPRRTMRTNIGANLLKNRDAKNVPAEVVIRSEINVKPQPRQQQQQQQQPIQTKPSPITLDADGIPVVHGKRVPDDPIDEIQVWRNARVINNQLVTDATVSTTVKGLAKSENSFERFFEDVNRRYGKLPNDANSQKPITYRNEVLAAEIYESAEDTYRPSIRKRMLQPEIAASYPNSRLYSPPDSAKSIAPSIKPGPRAPVLQYAHPELGVQPAKAVTKSESPKNSRRHEETFTEVPLLQQYVPHSGSHHYGEHRQKKKYVLNEKNIIDSYNYKNYYPYQQFYGLKRPVIEPPFWVKISEGIKNQFTDGVAKVSELTKPVFDPLVEATRKISENLGLSHSQDHVQDKVGSVATGSSVLIPALGLMASGAALGIGAVAVGRYLDVDVLKRSNDGTGVQYSNIDDDRTFEAIAEMNGGEGERLEAQPDQIYLLVQDDGSEEVGRMKRSIRNPDIDTRQIQRKGADSIGEIVEIDLPFRSLGDISTDEGNGVLLDNEEHFAMAIVRKTLEAIASKSKKDKEEHPEMDSLMTRRKRSLNNDYEFDEVLQNLGTVEVAEASDIPGDWSNTPCAKRIFCDTMVKRSTDSQMIMDKKMYRLLRMIQQSAAVQVSAHFHEVMEAVRRHDCSIFLCPQAKMPRTLESANP